MNTTAKIFFFVAVSAGIIYYLNKRKKIPVKEIQNLPIDTGENTNVFYNNTPSSAIVTTSGNTETIPVRKTTWAQKRIQQAVENGTVKTVHNSDPATWVEGDVVITQKGALAIIS